MNDLSEETLKEFTGYAVEEMEKLGLDPLFDRATVIWMDDYIDRIHAGLTQQRANYLAPVFAAFVGECMNRNFGSAWRYNEEFEECGVHHPLVGTAFVFSKVYRQFAGEGDSILELYDFVSAAINAGGLDKMKG